MNHCTGENCISTKYLAALIAILKLIETDPAAAKDGLDYIRNSRSVMRVPDEFWLLADAVSTQISSIGEGT